MHRYVGRATSEVEPNYKYIGVYLNRHHLGGRGRGGLSLPRHGNHQHLIWIIIYHIDVKKRLQLGKLKKVKNRPLTRRQRDIIIDSYYNFQNQNPNPKGSAQFPLVVAYEYV